MKSCPEEMGEEFEDFEKEAVEDSRLDHAGRQLSFCHWGMYDSQILTHGTYIECS